MAAAFFFLFFCFGITEKGQDILRGDISKIEDHWKLDDIYLGAGLAPIVGGLFPSVFFLILSGFSYYGDRGRRKNINSTGSSEPLP